MDTICCDEIFWVEQPGVLLTFGCNNEPCNTSQKKLRGGAATWNDITKILIVLSLVLLILKVSWWWILLVVGLLLIVFAYYNTHPTSSSCNKNKDKNTNNKQTISVSSNENITTKEGFNNMSRKQPNIQNPRDINVIKQNNESRYKCIDEKADDKYSDESLFNASQRRNASKTVIIDQDLRPRMTEKQLIARDREEKLGRHKFRDNNRLRGLDTPRIETDDRFSDDVTYEVETATAPPRKPIEGIDVTKKRYTLNYPVRNRNIMKDAFDLYKESFDDQDRSEANTDVERLHESAISEVGISFCYRN